jgi:hypothetical protein
MSVFLVDADTQQETEPERDLVIERSPYVSLAVRVFHGIRLWLGRAL